MSRSQEWRRESLGTAGLSTAERKQQLEGLRAESCAPSPLTPASLWEINKAKCEIPLHVHVQGFIVRDMMGKVVL